MVWGFRVLLLAPFGLMVRAARWWWRPWAAGGSDGRRLRTVGIRLASATAVVGAVVLFAAALWQVAAGEATTVALVGAAGTVAAGLGAALWPRR
ncbi:MAG: hypothetical protein M0R74_11035 [Dehalococcoidia bacterium]|nr:hypothetical protein [Dehalococcoidia bacterium]